MTQPTNKGKLGFGQLPYIKQYQHQVTGEKIWAMFFGANLHKIIDPWGRVALDPLKDQADWKEIK